MNCPMCGRAMLLLFTSYSCDHCESAVPDHCFVGFIVLDPKRPVGESSSYYVFPTKTDAAAWRDKRALGSCELRKVLSETPFEWIADTLTFKGMTLANRLFEIRADHRFEAAAGRAFLAPVQRRAAPKPPGRRESLRFIL